MKVSIFTLETRTRPLWEWWIIRLLRGLRSLLTSFLKKLDAE